MVEQAVLAGVRVLSLEQVHVLPWGTAFLADFGAQVIRVESADHMNDRRSGPFPDGEPGEEWWNEGGTFAYWGRNKESLCLDVTEPRGKEVFLKLVAQSDIVTDNFRPGTMLRLGLDHQEDRHDQRRQSLASGGARRRCLRGNLPKSHRARGRRWWQDIQRGAKLRELPGARARRTGGR